MDYHKILCPKCSGKNSVPYIPAITEILLEIEIVFDHFHVNALMNKALDEVRKEQQGNFNERKQKVLKGQRFLLLRHYKDLQPEFKDRVEAILQVNEPLFKDYVLKKQFRLFGEKKTLKEAGIFLYQWISDPIETGI